MSVLLKDRDDYRTDSELEADTRRMLTWVATHAGATNEDTDGLTFDEWKRHKESFEALPYNEWKLLVDRCDGRDGN